MADAQSNIWLFFKNFSNKFSISDLVNGNERKGSGPAPRKNITYNRLQTHDKGDFLSSSNPHLLDIVGGGGDKSPAEDELNKSHSTIATTTGRYLSTSCSKSSTSTTTKEKETTTGLTVVARKFTFPNRVTTYQEDETDGVTHLDKEKKKTHRFGHHDEDSDDSNWIECPDDDDDGESSSDFGDSNRSCGYCGYEKKYAVNGGSRFLE